MENSNQYSSGGDLFKKKQSKSNVGVTRPKTCKKQQRSINLSQQLENTSRQIEDETIMAKFLKHIEQSPTSRNSPSSPRQGTPYLSKVRPNIRSNNSPKPPNMLHKFHTDNKSRKNYLYNYLNFSTALKNVVQRVEQLKEQRKRFQQIGHSRKVSRQEIKFSSLKKASLSNQSMSNVDQIGGGGVNKSLNFERGKRDSLEYQTQHQDPPHILAISSEHPLPRKLSSSSYRRKQSFERSYDNYPINKNTFPAKELFQMNEDLNNNNKQLQNLDPDNIQFNQQYLNQLNTDSNRNYMNFLRKAKTPSNNNGNNTLSNSYDFALSQLSNRSGQISNRLHSNRYYYLHYPSPKMMPSTLHNEPSLTHQDQIMYKRLLHSVQNNSSIPQSQTISPRNQMLYSPRSKQNQNPIDNNKQFKRLTITQHKRIMSQDAIDPQNNRKNSIKIQKEHKQPPPSLSGSLRDDVVKSISNFLTATSNKKRAAIIRSQRNSNSMCKQFDVGKRRAKLLSTILGQQRFKKLLIQQQQLHQKLN